MGSRGPRIHANFLQIGGLCYVDACLSYPGAVHRQQFSDGRDRPVCAGRVGRVHARAHGRRSNEALRTVAAARGRQARCMAR